MKPNYLTIKSYQNLYEKDETMPKWLLEEPERIVWQVKKFYRFEWRWPFFHFATQFVLLKEQLTMPFSLHVMHPGGIKVLLNKWHPHDWSGLVQQGKLIGAGESDPFSTLQLLTAFRLILDAFDAGPLSDEETFIKVMNSNSKRTVKKEAMKYA